MYELAASVGGNSKSSYRYCLPTYTTNCQLLTKFGAKCSVALRQGRQEREVKTKQKTSSNLIGQHLGIIRKLSAKLADNSHTAWRYLYADTQNRCQML